jgi:tetratricopeptide (TPR) repeat protein
MKSKRAHRGSAPQKYLWWISILLMLCVFVLTITSTSSFRLWRYEIRETTTYNAHPGAALALQYGNDHFDSVNHPDEYDIARAQQFLILAAMQDPHLPTVYHQLARIAFLNDNLPLALAYINVQINQQGDVVPNSYYVRGLIEGYQGDYSDAVNDYAQFLTLEPHNWAGLNDYAWVLLKDNKPQQAVEATNLGLQYYPENPWLLNSNATALYEIGNVAGARVAIQKASQAVATLTPIEWSAAFPGNNPDIAQNGIATFKSAVADNLKAIFDSTSSTSTLTSPLL